MDFSKISDFISKHLKKIVAAGVISLGGGCLAWFLRFFGRKKQKETVKMLAPQHVDKELTVADGRISITTNDEEQDLSLFEEVPISSSEADEWKNVFSSVLGETAKTGTAAYSIHGLLKCDLPIKDLCRNSANPDAMRGYVRGEKGYKAHASFTEASWTKIAPLLVLQIAATATSQIYYHIITKKLNKIESKLDDILEYLEAKDRSKLEVSYEELKDLSIKSKYDDSDKLTASNSLRQVRVIKKTYWHLLSTVNPPDKGFSWSDKKEAENMIKALLDSKYLDYLERTLQAEILVFIASAICMRIAYKLGNVEDIEIYAEKMNPDFWEEYAPKFEEIRHNVVKTLELEADSSWFQEQSIRAMKEEIEKRFNEVEKVRNDLQEIYAQKTVQYIRIHEDGTVKKYMLAC